MLSERQMAVLSAVCDTFIPALVVEGDPDGFYGRRASDLQIPVRIREVLEYASTAQDQEQVKMLLTLLDNPLVNSLWGGVYSSILDLSLEARTALLQDWANSALPLRRKAISALRRMAGFLYYTVTDERGQNPNWAAMGYPGPNHPSHTGEKPIRPLRIEIGDTLLADVVIVGSGAGGGVLAGELSAAGLDVVVIEKGGYYAEGDFNGSELHAQQRLLERGGFLVTDDLSMLILAGKALGGGTVINWTASLRTPNIVLDEWEAEYGVTGFTGREYQASMDAVSSRLHVTEAESEANRRNQVLVRGAAAFGYAAKTIPRNVLGCKDCGFCCFGCPHGAKQSATRTYLQDAYTHGARLITHAEVDRVLIENGRAVGVEARARTAQGQMVNFRVRAKTVIAAAGAIHTPALLLRSGLSNTHIGRNLHLHPSSGTFGFFEEPINGWEGVMMSHYVSEFNNLDGRGYGVTLESAPGHPGLTAISFPWMDGLQHKELMSRYSHAANILIITRDQDGGRITLEANGQPRIHYQLGEVDKIHLLRGLSESMRIHHAAGAQFIRSPVAKAGMFSRVHDDLEAYIRSFEQIGLRRYDFVLGSAHQMSSCRMGGSPAKGAISPVGESYEVQGLYVADGSALPTATGVNPMLTIMSVAHRIAAHLKGVLR